MKNLYKKIIRDWFNDVTSSGSWKEYDDLHIDEIDHNCKNPIVWVNNGLKYLSEAILIRNEKKSQFIIALRIFLESTEVHEDINLNNLEEIKDCFEDTPPSLLAFLPDWDNWLEMLNKGIDLTSSINLNEGLKCNYYEYYTTDDKEYRRIIYIYG
jgi:hypothetical protein